MSKKALITGITGQDGSYLAEFLLEKGYEVHGVIRRASTLTTERIDHLIYPEEKIITHYGNLTEGIYSLIQQIQPDEIYNTAAMSHVRVSFDEPIYTFDVNATGVLRTLEAIRSINPKIKFLQCSSSEMFGMSEPPQNENTPFHPCSPYGIAKLAAYWAVRTYRDGYGLFASNQINFNHESPKRGKTFVTKKIVDSAVRIKHNKQKQLFLGNLDAKRDFGHAKDYVKAMWMVLQHDKPDDFVVASEDQVTIKEFMERVFNRLNLDWKKYVKFDDRYLRPKEVPSLLGDASKIKKILGWKAQYDLDGLIDDMIENAVKELKNGNL